MMAAMCHFRALLVFIFRGRCALPVAIALLCSASIAQTTNGSPLLWGDLQPGGYKVGFRVLYRHDRSRTWMQSKGNSTDSRRPIRISLWYPARFARRISTMQYGDYFHYESKGNFRDVNNDLEKYDRSSWLEDLNEVSPKGTEIFAKLCSTPVAAARSARPASGRFPLVLYAGGLGSRADANVELGEYLASHGYIMATVAQLGPSAEEPTLETTAGEAGVHVDDLEFAVKVLRRLPNVDAKHLAIAGHSAGGVAALEFAARNPEVIVVLGLDGSYGFLPEPHRTEEVMKALNRLDVGQVRAFLLDMRRADGVQGAKLDSTVVDRMIRSDRYLVTFTKMFHGDFTEFGAIGLKLSVPLPPNNDGRTRETGFMGNQHAYRAALAFLDANLKKKPEALNFFLAEIANTEGAKIAHKAPLP
jgi:dienelactone hydrolase